MTPIHLNTRLINLLLLTTLFFSTGFAPVPQTSTVNITIDVAQDRKSISPYIYGLNFAKETFANEIDLPIKRWGGNSTSRYNWQNGYLNTARDWYYENTTHSNAYDWSNPEDHNEWISQNTSTGAESLITIPMIGYVAKDNTSCGFSISKYGSQTDSDYWRPDCGNGINNSGYITGNDPLDTSIAADPTFMQNWVASMVAQHGNAANGGVQFYALDNEPELWSDTHRDVHPTHQSYDELLAKTISYGEAIKTADPTADILGFVSFGWTGYWYSRRDTVAAAQNGYSYFPDYATHGNMYQVEWYLSQMQEYEQTHDVRLLDYLDLHYYPENGVALTLAGNASTQALRLRSTRSLWDPTYRDESWIGGNDQLEDHRYVRLIPRMKAWVNTYYPGTKLAITEYNFGGLESMNGALTQADVLGIFGREGLDLATLWNYPYPNDPLGYYQFETLPGAYAFRMYRNYDGNGSKFGDVSISAISADQSQLAVYAAQRSGDSALTLIIINKTSSSLNSTVSISNFVPSGAASVYRYSASNLNAIVQLADQTLTGSGFSASFPANSITLVVIPSGTPTYPTVSSIAAQTMRFKAAEPVKFTVTFSESVTGVDTTDFRLTTQGLTNASISAVSGTGNTYTVTVAPGKGKGTIRLELVDNDSIRDTASNPLGGTGQGNGTFIPAQIVPLAVNPASTPSTRSSESSQKEVSPETAIVATPATEPYSRETFNEPPSLVPPKRRSPANQAAVPYTPTFHWTKISGGIIYEFQYSDTPDFSDPVFSEVTDKTFIHPGKMEKGKYYWRVRAGGPAGTWGPWSDIYFITITK